VSVPRRALADGTLDTGTVLVPGEAHRPCLTEQPIQPGQELHVHGPGGPNPGGSGRMEAFPAGGMWVTLRACGTCGGWYPAFVEEYLVQCPRCTHSTLPPLPDEAVVAMAELRWRLNEYQRVRERDHVGERAAFLQLSAATWSHAARLLRVLESLYGDQQVRQTHEIINGRVA